MSRLKDFTVFLFLLFFQSSHATEIVGGKEVKKHSLPYMALMVQKNSRCGGILIDPSWVLTAAHCENMKQVLLGVHSISKDPAKTRQVQKVKREMPHPYYRKETKDNDLMLLKLEKPVKETDTVKCFKLGKTIKDQAPRTSCLVAGWGITNYKNNIISDVLRSANVTVMDRKKCKSLYESHKTVITSNMICAGSKKADTCPGDSGGPLICGSELVGVTSFGPQKCGKSKDPGVYAFLSEKQLKWINDTIRP